MKQVHRLKMRLMKLEFALKRIRMLAEQRKLDDIKEIVDEAVGKVGNQH